LTVMVTPLLGGLRGARASTSTSCSVSPVCQCGRLACELPRVVQSAEGVASGLAASAGGNETSIVRPPCGCARALSWAPCVSTIAWTIESPSPCPLLCRVRALPSR